MSTNIRTIKGTYHKKVNGDFSVVRDNAEIMVTRFYNGKKLKTSVQITISQHNDDTSYIHLTKTQCNKLGKLLLECFDYKKYPSD